MSDFVDALPYIDHEFNDEQMREGVKQLIEDEMKRYKPTKNYLETLPNLPKYNITKFETEILRNEFERVKSNRPMDGLDHKRYEIPNPVMGQLYQVEAWQRCLDNSHAQLENQSIRLANLEVMSVFGVEAWKQALSHFTKQNQLLRTMHDRLTKEIQETNLRRKNSQLAAGEKIHSLEQSWVALISKNYEIEKACGQLQAQIEQLEKKANPTTNNDKDENEDATK